MNRFLLAAAASAAIVLSSPVAGQLVSALKAALPGRFVPVVYGALAVSTALAVVAALARIRHRRAARYAALGAAMLTATIYAAAAASGDSQVDAVERFHFVEYGILAWLFYRAWQSVEDSSRLVATLFCGLIVAIVDEWVQWFVPVRIGELRDVLIDLVAVACGVVFSLGVDPPRRFSMVPGRGSLARLGVLAAAAVLALAVFVESVYLGYELNAGGMGTFRSQYTKADLVSIGLERAAFWQEHPPIVLHRFSREDRYLTEAIWHVQRRNEAWQFQDAFAAWHENLILEAFYAPVLTTPTYLARAGNAWSAAERTVILLWPKWPLRVLALILACVAYGIPRLLDLYLVPIGPSSRRMPPLSVVPAPSLSAVAMVRPIDPKKDT